MNKPANRPSRPLSELLRAPAGTVDVRTLESDAAPGYPGQGKQDAEQRTAALEPELSDLQELLFANGRTHPETAPRILLVGATLAADRIDFRRKLAYVPDSPVLFDDIRAVAGRSPVLIGGRRWGAEGHWSGVRGYDAVRDVLLLANPADGYGGIHQTMSRQELAQRGPFSLVVLTHQGTPATPLPADPRDARISGLETALAHVCDVIVPRAAELQEEARRIRVQFLGEKP